MNPLVPPPWVAERLADTELVLLDASLPPVGVTPVIDTRARYLERHLPGAAFFDIEELSDKNTSLPHMLPAPEPFARAMSLLGVSDRATIVVYEQGAVFSAPRAWWMLRTLGAEKVHLLDGGLLAWTEAGLPIASGPVQRAPADFRARLVHAAVKDFAALQRSLEQRVQVLDARSTGRFEGTAPEPRPGLSAGHMPGAVSLPYTTLTDGDRMLPAPALRALFAQKGIDLQQPVTTTCGSGITAAVLALGLEICGAPQVSLYDGSWAEYAAHPGAEIITE